MRILAAIFSDRWLKLALLVVLIQQSIVALGTYLMGEMARRASSQGFDPGLAAALFVCVILPGSILHYAVSWFSTKAGKSVLGKYFQAYRDSNYDRPTRWRDADARRQRHDIMCRSGQDAINSTVHFTVDVAATSLNIALNTVAIILVTNRMLGAAICAAGVLGLWIIHLSDRRISEGSQAEMLADNELNAHLSRGWDNIILGNGLFFGRWTKRFERLFSAAEEASLDNVRRRDKAVALAGFLTTSLVVGAALGLAWFHRSDTGLVVALLIMLPRSLQIVMHMQIVQSYWAQWKSLREKLSITENSMGRLEPADLKQFIRSESIQIQFAESIIGISALDEILADAGNEKSGRYSVLGANGAGKSAMLLDIKARLGKAAIYLPTQHHLELENEGGAPSSGQTALLFLRDIMKEDARVLLLDEWDANLSPENRAIQDRLIDGLSRSRIVIEVRHARA